MPAIPTPPGFQDFYPDDLLVRNYLFAAWRGVARRYGFVEWEAPVVEMTDLYRRKSGDEIVSQLFHFVDQGGRDIALRPELTPSLARMLAARPKDFRRPLKWFEIGACFRAERAQKGRRREFIQFNADILGESGPGADAELIAMNIDLMRDLGFGAGDFFVRLSSRDAWQKFLSNHGVPESDAPAVLNLIDKRERDPKGSAEKLAALGIDDGAVAAFIADPENARSTLAPILDDLAARGMSDFVKPDLSIVRGLAYYTGTVFEMFDGQGEMRAVAGGGRYDKLVSLISDGKVDLPAIGFAMGNVVIGDLIMATGEPRMRLESWCLLQAPAEVYVVIADEAKRPEALATVQQLRAAGIATDYPLSSAKFAKQFQSADAVRAKVAVIIGSEYPDLSVKHLSSRKEVKVTPGTLLPAVKEQLASPGILIA